MAVALWDLSHWFSEVGVGVSPSGGAADVGALDVQSKLFSHQGESGTWASIPIVCGRAWGGVYGKR